MADILPFKPRPKVAKQKGRALCKHGHHKWKVLTAQQFDVKQGRLVTAFECDRCGKRKVEAI